MKLPRTLWAGDTKRGCDLSRTYAFLPCKIIPSTLDPPAPMSIQEIEAAITKLSAEDLAILAAWFAEYRAQGDVGSDRGVEQEGILGDV